MIINEIFGIKEPNADKLIKQIAKRLSDMSGYLHLAHTRIRYRDKNEYYEMEVKDFRDLQRQHESGEDVTQELLNMKNRLKKFNKNSF